MSTFLIAGCWLTVMLWLIWSWFYPIYSIKKLKKDPFNNMTYSTGLIVFTIIYLIFNIAIRFML